ncbi:MAG: flagellar assembly protein FliW [Geminicoccaceae bacterium]
MPLRMTASPPPDGAITSRPPELPVIRFIRGLPGFPGATGFTLHSVEQWPTGFLVMRSVDDPDLRFLLLRCARDALPLQPAELDDACARHGLRAGQVEVLLVVTLQPNVADGDDLGFHVNRRAPVLVDIAQSVGVQHVLDDPTYAVRAPLARAA